MQLFCQEKLILASHPWLSLEWARDREKKIEWCLVTVLHAIWVPQEGYTWVEKTVTYNEEKYWDKAHKIIWLPPTLPRVLNSLGMGYHYSKWVIVSSNNILIDGLPVRRKLLNEDWTDATLRDQSEETQNAIALLLGWETVKLDERSMIGLWKEYPQMGTNIFATS